MDAKTLASKLGITPKTVYSRAKILGISGTQAKVEGQNGRPTTVYTPEECDRIARFGKHEQSDRPDTEELEGEALESSALALTQTVALPAIQQFQAINSMIETFEDKAAEAISDRLSQVQSRILAKTAKKLEKQQGMDMSTVFGLLSVPSLGVESVPKFSPSDRRRLLECL